MSIYLARLHIRPAAELAAAQVQRWLPFAGGAARAFRNSDGTADLMEFSWSAALDVPFIEVDGGVVKFEGYPRWSTAVAEHFEQAVSTTNVPAIDAIPGSASGVVLRDPELIAYCGGAGDYGVYVRVTETDIAVSNRPALLLGLAGSAAVDAEGAMWLAGHGWRPGSSRFWRGIHQLRAGERLIARVSGDRIEVVMEQPDLHDHFREFDGPAARAEIEGRLGECVASLASIDVDPARWRLPLSGGKDSRAVLALIAAAGRLHDVGRIFTTGPQYGVDVLAAVDVAKAAGVERHVIQCPPLEVGQVDLGRLVLQTLVSTQGSLSLYDTHNSWHSSQLSFGGHQYALRPELFGTLPSHDFELFFRHLLTRKPLDPVGVLAHDAVQDVESSYRAMFLDLQGRGVPLHKLGPTAYWLMRSGGWLANLSGGNQYANPLVNPLLDTRLLTLACALPKTCIDGEVIHYLALRLSGYPLAAEPFASDTWRPELSSALTYLGVNAEVRPVVPYTTPGGLGLLADRFRPGVKVQILRMLAPVTSQLLRERRADLPFLDVEASCAALTDAVDTTPTPAAMISLLGLGTIVLCQEYGLDLFDQTRREDVAQDITARVAASGHSGLNSAGHDPQSALGHMLAARDDALAAIVRERHALQSALTTARSALALARRPLPLPHRLFRVLPVTTQRRLRGPLRRLRHPLSAGRRNREATQGAPDSPRE